MTGRSIEQTGGATRRSLLLAAPALWLGAAYAARASSQPQTPASRIVSLNWAVSETLYALNIRPIGVAEIAGYDRMVGYPPTPAGMTDLGFQSDPNLELLANLKPDLILIQSWQAMARPALEHFAPVASFSLYDRGKGDPIEAACEATTRISNLAGQPEAGADLLARTDTIFRDCAHRLADGRRPVLLVQALSPTNLVVFTHGSLFDSVMRRIGLTNAWSQPPTLLWGSTQIRVDALADYPHADIVWMASPDGGAAQALFSSDLWKQLPQVSGGAVYDLPLVWGFGALPTAERFAGLITARLTESAG